MCKAKNLPISTLSHYVHSENGPVDTSTQNLNYLVRNNKTKGKKF